MIFDIVFIGAGASSLMAASLLKNHSIALVDSSSKIAPKIKISGGGRCNFTNKIISSDNFLGDKELLDKTFKSYDNSDLLKFFKKYNLEYNLKDNQKYFCKNSSSDILDIFSKQIRHCSLFLNHTVMDVEFDRCFIVETDKKTTIKAKKLVVASGGLSYASLGASDIGYKIAKKFGHTIKTTSPALVGFTLQKEQFWMKNLSGISCRVALHVEDEIFIDDLLFAHKGISGPAVLNASLYWRRGVVSIDFLPKVNVVKLLEKKSKKQISSLLPLPKRFVKEYLKSINLDDVAIDRLSKSQKEKLYELNHYIFAPAGNFGYTKAEVTKGGIDTNDINHLSFESSLQKNLYFIGEVLDVTGELGGYNLQWAFSSAVVMSKNMECDK